VLRLFAILSLFLGVLYAVMIVWVISAIYLQASRIAPEFRPYPSIPLGAYVQHAVIELILSILPILWLVDYRKRRRWKRDGKCRRCGYDLRASRGQCSECGGEISD
jgi:hypothetical protein